MRNLSLLDFYATLGEVCRNTGRHAEAERADRKAISIFQSSLAALLDPRDRLALVPRGFARLPLAGPSLS